MQGETDGAGRASGVLDAEAALAECALLRGRPLEALHIADSALKNANEDNASVLPTIYRVRGFALLTADDVDAARVAFDTGLDLQSPASRHEAAFLTIGRAKWRLG